jgi:hypothetical protein
LPRNRDGLYAELERLSADEIEAGLKREFGANPFVSLLSII